MYVNYHLVMKSVNCEFQTHVKTKQIFHKLKTYSTHPSWQGDFHHSVNGKKISFQLFASPFIPRNKPHAHVNTPPEMHLLFDGDIWCGWLFFFVSVYTFAVMTTTQNAWKNVRKEKKMSLTTAEKLVFTLRGKKSRTKQTWLFVKGLLSFLFLFRNHSPESQRLPVLMKSNVCRAFKMLTIVLFWRDVWSQSKGIVIQGTPWRMSFLFQNFSISTC